MLYKDTFIIFIKKLLPSAILAVVFFSAAIVFAASNLVKPATTPSATPIHPNILELNSIYKAHVLSAGFVKLSTTTVSELTSIYKNYIIEPASTLPITSEVKNTNTPTIPSASSAVTPVKISENIPPTVKTAQATSTTLELSAFYKNYITQVPSTSSNTPTLPHPTSP